MDDAAGEHDHTMRDFEVALMDTVSTIFEVLVAKNIVPAETAAEALRHQRDSYPAEMPGAVFVMNCLIDRLAHPERAAARKLLQDPPQGTA